MQCPYCAEEIKDQAKYCRYCAHDLSFFKITEPMLESISSLEDQISSLEDQVSSLKEQISEIAASTHAPSEDQASTTTARSSGPRVVSSFRRPISAVGLLVFVLIATLITAQILYGVQTLAYMSADEAMQINRENFLGWDLGWTDILFLGAPLVAGGWLRIKQHQKHLKSYIALGVFVGVVTVVARVLLEHTVLQPSYTTVQDDIANGIFILEDILDLVWGLGIHVAAITMFFVSGGLFGGLIDAWRSNRSITENATNSKKIVGKVISPKSQSFEKVVKLLTVLYGPTLVFSGTVLTLLFGAK